MEEFVKAHSELVKSMIADGMSDEEILEFMTLATNLTIFAFHEGSADIFKEVEELLGKESKGE